MKKFFINIKKYFNYALRSAKSELKSEVADSYLSWLWWILEPLCFSLIYVFVFGYIFPSNQEYFAVFVCVGLAAWTFFNRMITCSVRLLFNNRDLVSKVYIPKYILLLSKSFTYLFKFFISMGISLVLMIFMGVPFDFHMLYFFLILPVMYVVSFGISSIIMHFGVFVEDLQNIVDIGLKLVFYLSGVFYNINTRLDGTLGYILLRFNPIAFIMNEFRKVIIYANNPSFEGLFVWFIIGVILTAIGVHTISKHENSYAKVI